MTDALFDGSLYASTVWAKARRALQLGPRYYLRNLPRYYSGRRKAGLPVCDWKPIVNPLGELRQKMHQRLPLPDVLGEALDLLRSAGVRLSLPRVRVEGLVAAWWSTRGVPGDMMECGAYRGATSLLLATLSRLANLDRRLLVLDAFQNRLPTSWHDGMMTGREYDFVGDVVGRILEQAERLNVLDRMDVWRGTFFDTFRLIAARGDTFSFVHIDANYYAGTSDACAFALARTLPGAAIVFDDYNGVCDLGARLAIDECLAPSSLRPVALAGCSAMLRIPGAEAARVVPVSVGAGSRRTRAKAHAT
ncbi:MAG TPA: TylF/MycF/NovP-related O-methyltransferase [Pirellulales bacterium]|nr:TylF/MycF/NovP-related O-methyltransferase [Pirellulales bacterium]